MPALFATPLFPPTPAGFYASFIKGSLPHQPALAYMQVTTGTKPTVAHSSAQDTVFF